MTFAFLGFPFPDRCSEASDAQRKMRKKKKEKWERKRAMWLRKHISLSLGEASGYIKLGDSINKRNQTYIGFIKYVKGYHEKRVTRFVYS